MKIERVSPGTLKLAQICDVFTQQLLHGSLKPKLLKLSRPGSVQEQDRLLVCTDYGELKGALIYHLVYPKNIVELAETIAGLVRDASEIRDIQGMPINEVLANELLGFRSYDFIRPLAFVDVLEAFPQKNGNGRKLIRSLQSQGGIEGIFLESDVVNEKPSYGFYEKVGFIKSGVYISSPDKPVMVWMKSGQY